VKHQPARSFLPAAVFILLSVMLMSGTSTAFAAKGFVTIDPFTSTCSLADSDAGKPDGYDDNPVHRPNHWINLPPEGRARDFPHDTTPALARVFTASRARAPPLS
jgi:hypothetical protein